MYPVLLTFGALAAFPAARAAELAELHELIERDGFHAPPTQHGKWTAGSLWIRVRGGVAELLYQAPGMDPAAEEYPGQSKNCLQAAPQSSEASSASSSTLSQVGARVVIPFVAGSVRGQIEKTVVTQGTRDMQFGRNVLASGLRSECVQAVRGELARGAQLEEMFVVTSVRMAQIRVTSCTRISAGVRKSMVAGDAGYADSCVLDSDEPVTIGYTIAPLSELSPALANSSLPGAHEGPRSAEQPGAVPGHRWRAVGWTSAGIGAVGAAAGLGLGAAQERALRSEAAELTAGRAELQQAQANRLYALGYAGLALSALSLTLVW